MDQASLKKEIRKRILKFRTELSTKTLNEKSHKLFELWKSHCPLDNVNTLHLFMSIDKFNEVKTSTFIEYLQIHHPKIKLVIPITDLKNNVLRHMELKPDLQFEKNAWGIPEPKFKTTIVPEDSLDMILVPLLAFDNRGNRLGYGKGFYDKFLGKTKSNCLKIGLCLEIGHVSNPLPIESTDIPLDLIISESRVYSFAK